MELFYILSILIIFAEVTILLAKTINKPQLHQNQKRKVFVDTSALMDGRILSVAETGFIGDDIIITKSVIAELQLLADNKDSEKRARARAGLDVINELERIVHFDVQIYDDHELGRMPVDERLIVLAKEKHGLILTLDFNLIKVAHAQNLETLNINDLTLSLRSEFLPGEKILVKINSEGSNPGQGVGHLQDGTMVVVDNASKMIGQEIEVEFIRFFQTSAGKMIFAHPVHSKNGTRPKQRS